jgi:hypothetical protein
MDNIRGVFVLDMATAEARPKKLRSGLTNNPHRLDGVDMRTQRGRRYRDIVDALIAEFGMANPVGLRELAGLKFSLKSYRCTTIRGDRFAGEWPREQLGKHGVEYAVADKTRSEIYLELLPLINSRRVALLDHQRLVTQLVGLERKTSRAGKDSIDHAQGGHDDVINAAAGAIVNAAKVVRDHEISFHPPDLTFAGIGGELRRHFGETSSYHEDFTNRMPFSGSR